MLYMNEKYNYLILRKQILIQLSFSTEQSKIFFHMFKYNYLRLTDDSIKYD